MMRKFSLKQLFSYGLAVLVQKFTGFIILPIVAAHLSVSDFGLSNQIISIGGFYILIVMLGLDESIAKKGFDTDSKKSIYIANGFCLLIINVAIFSSIAILIPGILYTQLVPDVSDSIILLSVILVSCTPFFLVYLKILRLSHNSKEFFIVVVAQVFIQSALMILFVVNEQLGAKGFLLSHALTYVGCALYVAFKLRYAASLGVIDSTVAKELLMYGSKIAPHSIATWGLWGLTVVFTGKTLGSESSAQLVAMYYIPLIANVMSFAFFYTYQPWLYENLKSRQNPAVLKSNLWHFTLIFLLVVIAIWFLSGFIFGFLFDERYKLDETLVIILLAACFFQFVGSMLTYILYYFESVTKYVGISTLSGGIINLLLLVGTSSYGLLGICISFMVANFVILLIRAYIAIGAINKYGKITNMDLSE